MSKSLFRRFGLLAATALTAVTLIACGGDSSAPAQKVATSDLGITIAAGTTQEASIVALLKAAPYTFTKDVVIAGVTYKQPVKITVTGNSTANLMYSVEDSTAPIKQTGSGALAFGSCILKVTSQPDTIFDPCTLRILLKGKTFTPGGPIVANVAWSFANNEALAGESIVGGDFTFTIAADGQVSLRGTPIGKVSLSDVTGATGSN